jgi:hypothetical protein
MYTGMDVDDDLGSAMDTETLADRDLMPPGFDNPVEPEQKAPKSRPSNTADTLKAERSAALRKGAKISKI